MKSASSNIINLANQKHWSSFRFSYRSFLKSQCILSLRFARLMSPTEPRTITVFVISFAHSYGYSLRYSWRLLCVSCSVHFASPGAVQYIMPIHFGSLCSSCPLCLWEKFFGPALQIGFSPTWMHAIEKMFFVTWTFHLVNSDRTFELDLGYILFKKSVQ